MAEFLDEYLDETSPNRYAKPPAALASQNVLLLARVLGGHGLGDFLQIPNAERNAWLRVRVVTLAKGEPEAIDVDCSGHVIVIDDRPDSKGHSGDDVYYHFGGGKLTLADCEPIRDPEHLLESIYANAGRKGETDAEYRDRVQEACEKDEPVRHAKLDQEPDGELRKAKMLLRSVLAAQTEEDAETKAVAGNRELHADRNPWRIWWRNGWCLASAADTEDPTAHEHAGYEPRATLYQAAKDYIDERQRKGNK